MHKNVVGMHKKVGKIVSKTPLLIGLLSLVLVGFAWGQDGGTYRVKAGDTLFRIAMQYDLTVDALKQLNGLRSNRIAVGQVLKVKPEAAAVDSTITYTVRQGDTMYRIATEHGVTVEQMLAWNELGNDLVSVGQSLSIRIPLQNEQALDEGASPETDQEAFGLHVVAAGETLYGISHRYDLPVDSLLALNQGLADPIQVGDSLRLPQAFAFQNYTVRRGDTLAKIGRSYGVGVQAIMRANELRSDRIAIGQQLRIPAAGLPVDLGTPDYRVIESGDALLYPASFAGRLTASGAVFDPDALTVSHKTQPFGTVLLLRNPETQQTVFVQVNDRGPASSKYLLDIAPAVAEALGISTDYAEGIEILEAEQ